MDRKLNILVAICMRLLWKSSEEDLWPMSQRRANDNRGGIIDFDRMMQTRVADDMPFEVCLVSDWQMCDIEMSCFFLQSNNIIEKLWVI